MNQSFDAVIFGGTGDLAQRKLIPSLYRIVGEGVLESKSKIILVNALDNDVGDFKKFISETLKKFLNEGEYTRARFESFFAHIEKVDLDITQYKSGWAGVKTLFLKRKQPRVFYFAIPSALYGPCCENIAQAGLNDDLTRLVVEKPIGYDAPSARAINEKLWQYFDEESIFRIDHYLGKETVQNLLALRFSNAWFEHLWDAKSIDHVQISISESVGVEGRGGFYEGTGAIRDMVQNHILQLLCLIAMESPNSLTAENIRGEKVKVMEALRPLTTASVYEDSVTGQYVPGEVDGALASGYLEDIKKSNSHTETFVAIRAFVDNWRWAGVPFYLRTGKRMKVRSAEIIIQYKAVSHRVWDKDVGPIEANRMIIKLQPEESIQLKLMSKDMSCLDMKLESTSLNLNFSDTYDSFKSDAYKRLIMDAANGNSALFIHRREIEAAWAWIDPIIAAWRDANIEPKLYRAGTWGPEESDELIQFDGRSWYNTGEND